MDRHLPSFQLWPHNNNRTAWANFSLPVVLAVPHTRTASGLARSDSGVRNVRIAIEGAPREGLVAGHDHVGLRFPEEEVYTQTLTTQELLDRRIDLGPLVFTNQDGEEVDQAAAENGDSFTYTTTSGVRGSTTYYVDADYYDLSDLSVETEHLPPRRYNLIYSCNFYARVITTDAEIEINELICIDVNRTGEATLRFGLNHPGEVIREVTRLTPACYLTGPNKAEDSTIRFYRPFTDVIQNVFDEQKFLESANWVSKIPYESIPYLSQLLGWDIPYFPESLDQLRKLILRKTRQLQNLKGSRRAVRELMSLFGFTVLIKNMWYAEDGSRFITPAETLPPAYDGQEITYIEKFQVEPLLAEYVTNGFGDISAPLLFRPQRINGLDPFQAAEDSDTLTIDAYLVEDGSDADLALAAQAALMEADPDGYGSSANCSEDDSGFIDVGNINDALAGLDVIGHSQILVDGGFGIDQAVAGVEPPFRVVGPPLLGGISFDKDKNDVHFVFDHYIDFEADGTKLYIFASYKRQEVSVPTALVDLQSNRFSIQILTRENEQVRTDVLDFVLDFVRKIKAFHSILAAIQYRVDLNETYQVTDFCVGGDVTQRYDVPAGRQQVPPAIIPTTPGDDCSELSPIGQGYKDSDLAYRRIVIGALIEEFAAWKALDGRADTDDDGLRLDVPPKDGNGDCQYTPLGQDRVVGTDEVGTGQRVVPDENAGQHSGYQEPSPLDAAGDGSSSDSDSSLYGTVNVETSSGQRPWCTLDGMTDYCYKGRVRDELFLTLMPALPEMRRNISCGPSAGAGVYWTYPTTSVRVAGGVKRLAPRSLSRRSVHSGGSTDVGQTAHDDGPHGGPLSDDYDRKLPRRDNNFLGRLLRSYGKPINETIHYSDRKYVTGFAQKDFLALQRRSLDIAVTNHHFPGCRFPMMRNLLADFTSETWRARPWDEQYSSDDPCCQGTPSWLNAELVENTNGDLVLSFDDVAFTVLANGLAPDITSFGEHTSADPDSVVHSIYSSQADGHESITLEQLCDCGTPGDVIDVDEPFFSSANLQATGGYVDFCDGYPCDSGQFAYEGDDVTRDGLFAELMEALEVPGAAAVTVGQQLLFRSGSGIKDGSTGLRFDCGCQQAEGDATDGSVALACANDLYIDQYGDRDWSPDHIVIEPILLFGETLGLSGFISDGSIPSSMEMVE